MSSQAPELEFSACAGFVRPQPLPLPWSRVRCRQPTAPRGNTMPTLSRRHLFGATLGGATAAMLSGIGTELAPRAQLRRKAR